MPNAMHDKNDGVSTCRGEGKTPVTPAGPEGR